MSLMLKLLITIVTLNSLIYANDAQVISFLKKGIGANPEIISLDISIVNKLKLKRPKGWQAYILQLNGKAEVRGEEKDISQRSIYFVGDGVISPELYDLKTGDKLSSSISPILENSYYDDEHYLFGNKDAKHKVVLFSDPLCPFCRDFVPDALSYMKKYPKTFVVYYYHLPLIALHPASETLVKAAIVAQMQGREGIINGLYKIKVDPRQKDRKKVLDAFNKTQNTNITLKEIDSDKVKKIFNHDLSVAQKNLVNGTPTIFLDGKKDPKKMGYTKVKIIK